MKGPHEVIPALFFKFHSVQASFFLFYKDQPKRIELQSKSAPTPNPSLPVSIPIIGARAGGGVESHYTVWQTHLVSHAFGLASHFVWSFSTYHIDRLTSCWQPVISKTCHTSLCFLPHTPLVPPEATWPCSNGSGKSTAQKCKGVYVPRGSPRPTGARGQSVSVPLPSPSMANSPGCSQWDQGPLAHGSDLLNSTHSRFPSFLLSKPQSFASALWAHLSHKLSAHRSWLRTLLFRVTIYGPQSWNFKSNNLLLQMLVQGHAGSRAYALDSLKCPK